MSCGVVSTRTSPDESSHPLFMDLNSGWVGWPVSIDTDTVSMLSSGWWVKDICSPQAVWNRFWPR